MTTTLCQHCASEIESHRGALCITFSGYGDAGFIDTYLADDPQLVVCVRCAAALRATLAPLVVLDPFLNINYTHVCDGEFKPVPLTTCPDDPDSHGWREVFTVRPAGRIRSRELWYVCDTLEQAESLAAACQDAGHPALVSRQLIGNIAEYFDQPAPPLG